ncbi:DNA repair protein RecN [Variibacter gotjawalensis]|uniref:DNA repair protein RecN n=1 Tax=Variibacter gotjawalensis TaxID=1333996 RepID=A0A0S3PTW7_9BRAD|nr:DNA repair protein RecN [Variibacter gotjawalensis]NIK49641.1 DNA repair protein RecN (Recombination protein N) [Variibacter gotjawalensis]RZS45653.1 DNA replication and repair protein RecN [Variibacter gotjawalensis]BAT59324.1 DNA repair protein RecN [Variibacter gotjawalensis]
MLSRLSIRDIVLIDRLDIEFAEGLSVLTGETGAGKSILLDAFTLALGARGDSSLVRQGAEQGQVIAAFDIAAEHPANAVLRANDIPIEDELIVRRVQLADGRTRASINDAPVGVHVLKALGAALVEIHGQHDDRALTDASTHRSLVDAFGGLEVEARKITTLWDGAKAAREALATQIDRIAAAEREADWLRHAAAELTKLKPEPGEEQTLAARRTTMMAGEKIAEDLRAAHETVAGSDSPAAAIASAIRRLERRAGAAPELIEPSVKALDAALNAIDDARHHLDAALVAANHDPHELERIEERLFALRAAARKYNTTADNLAALADRYLGDLAALDAGTAHVSALEKAAREAEEAFRTAAKVLSEKRRKAAAKLDTAVNRELPPLKLDRAKFSTSITGDAETAGPDGFDRVEFWVQTNPGTRPGPMMKVASGGELSRFLLALKVVLADRGSAPTLIFDEIDTGVGGAVADAIGQRLARLAAKVQVVSVTHAPQVAARAARHYLIAKDAKDRGRRVATGVVEVAADKRREEIARMLAGAEITEEARAAAERLIRAAAE